MSNSDFGGARAILVEPNRETLAYVRNELKARGFGEIITAPDLGQLEAQAVGSLIDVVICDAQIDGGGFSKLASRIRHGGFGPNPYLVTVATTSDPTEVNIGRAIGAGIDVILVKPYSLGSMLDRLGAIVRARKSFVVSSEYIGPDRRLRPRQRVSLPLVEAPNSLKERVQGTYSEARLLNQIAETNKLVNRQRATQNASLIYEIVRQIVPHFKSGSVDDAVLVHLHHLARTAEDISNRMRHSGDEHVLSLCRSIIPIARKLIANHTSPDATDVRLLKEMATAVYLAYGAGEEEAAMSVDVARSIESSKRFRVSG